MNAAVQHWGASHPGTIRHTNQDSYLCRPDLGLFVVADGVGGHPGGAFASAAVTRELGGIAPGLSPLDLLRAVRARVEATHRLLLAEAAAHRHGVTATTIVALLLHGRHLACLWAGDSRAYLLRAGTLVQLTADHSLVGDLLRAGELTADEAERHPSANVITRAIGVETATPLVDRAIGQAEPGDRFLLCSDGLNKALPIAALADHLRAADPAAALVAAAVERGATDNVTAVVAMV